MERMTAKNPEGDAVLAPEYRSTPSRAEYDNIRRICAAYQLYKLAVPWLEKRAKLVPGCWRELRICEVLSEHAMYKILQTIPTERLQIFGEECKHLVTTIAVDRNVSGKAKDFDACYVPFSTLKALVSRVTALECLECGLTGKEARRCELRRIIANVAPFETEIREDGECPMRED